MSQIKNLNKPINTPSRLQELKKIKGTPHSYESHPSLKGRTIDLTKRSGTKNDMRKKV